MKLILVFMVAFSLVSSAATAADKVGGGDITFKPKNAGEVVFSHEKHVSEKGLKCTGCHYTLFQKQHGTYKMDLSKINKEDFCIKCHNGLKTFDVEDQKNCIKCHK